LAKTNTKKLGGWCESPKTVLFTLGEFSHTNAADLAPYACDALGPFEGIYETDGTGLLQAQWLHQVKDPHCGLHLGRDQGGLMGCDYKKGKCKAFRVE